jgi:predicted amidohydrolase
LLILSLRLSDIKKSISDKIHLMNKLIGFIPVLIILCSCNRRPETIISPVEVDRSFKLAMVQMYVEGGALDVNLKHAAERIGEAAQNGADIALLPEVLDLGWTHSSALKLAYPVPGGMTFNALAEVARKNNIYVCAGIVEKDGDKIYNSAVLIDNQGKLLIKHRKLNELDIAHNLYSQGDRLNVCHTRFGTIGIHICADAFAKDMVLSRSLGYMGADIILSPSSWAVPPHHDNLKDPYGDEWNEAYEPVAKDFRMWIIGVSNVGPVTDGPWKGWNCIGSSLVIDPDGNEVLQGPYGVNADTIMYIDITTLERPARGTDWQKLWQNEKNE